MSPTVARAQNLQNREWHGRSNGVAEASLGKPAEAEQRLQTMPAADDVVEQWLAQQASSGSPLVRRQEQRAEADGSGSLEVASLLHEL